MQIRTAFLLGFIIAAQAKRPTFVSRGEMVFLDADRFCKQNDGHLAQPTTARDTYFDANESVSKYWLGAYTAPSGARFWTNGKPIPWWHYSHEDRNECPMDKCYMVMRSPDHVWLYALSTDEGYLALCEPSTVANTSVTKIDIETPVSKPAIKTSSMQETIHLSVVISLAVSAVGVFAAILTLIYKRKIAALKRSRPSRNGGALYDEVIYDGSQDDPEHVDINAYDTIGTSFKHRELYDDAKGDADEGEYTVCAAGCNLESSVKNILNDDSTKMS